MKTEKDFDREKYPEEILEEGRRERGWEKKKKKNEWKGEKLIRNSTAWTRKRDER